MILLIFLAVVVTIVVRILITTIVIIFGTILTTFFFDFLQNLSIMEVIILCYELHIKIDIFLVLLGAVNDIFDQDVFQLLVLFHREHFGGFKKCDLDVRVEGVDDQEVQVELS